MAGWSWLDVCQDIPRPSTGCQPSTRRRRKKTSQRETNQNKDGIAISIESQLDAATMLSVHSCPRPEGRGPRTKTTTKTQNHDQDHNKCKDQDVLDWVTKWLIGLGERQWFGRWCGHNEKKSMDEENNVCASCQERFLWRSPNLQLSLSLLTLPTPGRPSANQCQDPPSYTRQQLEVQTLDVCYTLPVLVSVNSTISTSENLPLCVPFLPRAVHCVGSSRISTVS